MVVSAHSTATPCPGGSWSNLASLPVEGYGLPMLMLNFLLKNVHHGLMVSMIALLITAFNHSFWVVFKAPEGGVDTSCSFSLLLCVSCLWLMIKPKYILSTNFWCVRSISLFLDLHLGSCFSLPFFGPLISFSHTASKRSSFYTMFDHVCGMAFFACCSGTLLLRD
jgi:hypothetical protein